MSIESFIRAMPKVELNVRLEGAINPDTLIMIAEQNDVSATYKTTRQYQAWLKLLHEPDPARSDEIARTTAAWLKDPEDIARAVYELGVSFSKQNVHYAEVTVNPAIFTDNDMTFETLMASLSDGRDKALRGWQVEINWILAIPRDRPRKADDIARWATSATARKHNVVAISLVGDEDVQPVGQFRRAFGMAQKRELPRVTHALSDKNPEPLQEVLQLVLPSRINDVWYGHNDPDVVNELAEQDLPIVVTPSREVALKRIKSVADYPFNTFYERVPLVISASMPTMYKTTLVDELLALAQHHALTSDQLEELCLNSVRYSFLEDATKDAMLADFQAQFEALRHEHLADA